MHKFKDNSNYWSHIVHMEREFTWREFNLMQFIGKIQPKVIRNEMSEVFLKTLHNSIVPVPVFKITRLW